MQGELLEQIKYDYFMLTDLAESLSDASIHVDDCFTTLDNAGFAVVPKEPTEKMVIAGATEAMQGQSTSSGGTVIFGQPKDVYRAMIKAANSKGKKQMTTENPPAFPVYSAQKVEGVGSFTKATQEGMTLRDYFAGQALAGFISSGPHDCDEHGLAHDAYLYADAMLEARTPPNTKE